MTPPKGKPTALTVDDDPDFTAITKLTLEKLGMDVVTTSNVDEFLAKIRSFTPDLCLIDLNITNLGDGFKIVQEVRTTLSNAIPLIIVSSIQDQQSIAHAIELGANDFIIKPTDREFIASKLSRYTSSDELLVAQIPTFPTPKKDASVTLDLPFDVQAVDELGIKLISPHLINKGTTVEAQGDLLTEITGQTEGTTFKVANSAANPDGTYLIYLEFDFTDEELLKSVRTWLVS